MNPKFNTNVQVSLYDSIKTFVVEKHGGVLLTVCIQIESTQYTHLLYTHNKVQQTSNNIEIGGRWV